MELNDQDIQKIKREAVVEYVKAKHIEEEAEALKERKSPYEKGWIQLNKEAKGKMLWLMKHHIRAYGVLSFLIFHMDKENAVVATYNTIQEALQISRPTAVNSIKILKDYNFIYVYKTGSTNIYTTNADLAWTTYGKNLRYAKLKGNILIAESEQVKTQIERNSTIKIIPPDKPKQERKRIK